MSRSRRESEAEKRARLQEAYTSSCPPEYRAAWEAQVRDWFDSIMPVEWEEVPPLAEIISSFQTVKSPIEGLFTARYTRHAGTKKDDFIFISSILQTTPFFANLFLIYF